jgi:hypothetical protein
MVAESTIHLDKQLRIGVECVMVRDKDKTLGQAARRLLRKALEAEGVKEED